jgi:RNA polymerase sigma factor (sigma-70 family)
MDRGLSTHAPGGPQGAERDRRWVAVYAHRDRLMRLARSRVGDPHDAEDCVSEAMLRCVEFEALDETRLGPFLTTVTLRVCADLHRRNARGDRLSRRLAAYTSVEPGPEEAVCDRAESVWLTGHLDGLPPRQREIVAARAEGLSCAAVAERLVTSYGAIESALARVRRSMRVTLESTLGVAAVPARRWLQVAGEALTAGAIVLGGAQGTPVAAPPARPAVSSAASSAPHVTTAGAPRPTTQRATREAVRAVLPVAPPLPVAPAGDKTYPEGTNIQNGDTTPLVSAGTKPHNYSKVERWQHCLKYGVDVGRHTECRYPPDDDDTTPHRGLR